MSKKIEHEFDSEVYAILSRDGEDLYYNVSDDKVGTVEMADETPALVATYKLVKVERLTVKKQTVLVKA